MRTFQEETAPDEKSHLSANAARWSLTVVVAAQNVEQTAQADYLDGVEEWYCL